MVLSGHRVLGVFVASALTVVAITACGGSQPEPTSTPVPAPTSTPTKVVENPTPTMAPPTNTPIVEQPSSPLNQPASPLNQPESPLGQPASPLPSPEASTENGPFITQLVPSDFDVISELAADTKADPPSSGKASISAVLYSPSINRVIPGTAFYLTKAIEDNGKLLIPTLFGGPNPEKGDIAGFTNDYGQLILQDVAPGNYYLVVWTVYNWPLAFAGPDEPLPLLLQLSPDETRDLGLLYVEWP